MMDIKNTVLKARDLFRSRRLDASQCFLKEDVDTISANVNGCGAANAKFDFVPHTVYGMDIKTCCIIHDWDYFIGIDNDDKEIADRRFLNNMLRTLESQKDQFKIIKKLRRRRIKTYYSAVKHLGGPAFWDGKN